MEDSKSNRSILKTVLFVVIVIIIYLIGFSRGYNKGISTKPAQSEPVVVQAKSMDTKRVPEGMYRVGKDIPPGEYKLTENDPKKYGAYYSVTSDSTGSSQSRIHNDNFVGQSFITVKDGEYIKTVRCYMEKVN